jgi:uncharacterized membrane protein YjdF
MALALALSLHGLAASGHFPRTPDRPSQPQPIVLFGSMAVAIFCAIAGIAAVARLIPWYAAIIGGGLSVLSAPLVLQRFTDNVVDGSTALIAFATLDALLTLALLSMAFP